MAYGLLERDPTFHVTAHSTRNFGTSWAIQNKASVAQICKAATWSSVNTFTKYFKVDVRPAVDTIFRRVLQTAVKF